MSQQEIICTICPLGCHINVVETSDKAYHVTGNQCKQGKAYAIAELENPLRVFTSTLLVESGDRRLLSIRTSKPVPKEFIKEMMLATSNLKVKAPIKMGQEIIHDILRTGANIISTNQID